MTGERTPRPALTAHQVRILRLVARGHTAPGIAARLGVRTDTVHAHLLAARRTLGARTGPHAVALAMAAGLIRAEEITNVAANVGELPAS